MSNYVNRAWIAQRVPPQTLLEALDDNADGQEDDGLFDGLAESVSNDIDEKLGPDATVATALRTSAANILFCSLVYKRRGIADASNPWAKRETETLKELNDIATGARRAEPTPAPAGATTTLISERAKSFPQSGKLIC